MSTLQPISPPSAPPVLEPDAIVVSVVIPCLNEEDNIEACVRAALGALHDADITGEVVVAVGATGLNFGSGMTSVFALMLDQDNKFVDRYNRELIDIHRIDSENMEAHCNYLHELLTEYVAETESDWGRHFGRLFQLRAPLLADQADRLGARIADRQPAPGPGGLIANKRGV